MVLKVFLVWVFGEFLFILFSILGVGLAWDLFSFHECLWVLGAGDVGRVIEPRVGRLVGPVAVHWQGAAEICPKQRYGLLECLKNVRR